MDRRIDAHIARTQFGQIMDLATKNNERFVVDRRGEPAVVIMSVQDFIRTAAPPPDWLEKAWGGAKRRGLDTLTSDESMPRSPRTDASRTPSPPTAPSDPGGHRYQCAGSGLLSPAGNEALILLAIHQGLVHPCFSEEILEEYAAVLARPRFAFLSDEIAAVLAMFRSRASSSFRRRQRPPLPIRPTQSFCSARRLPKRLYRHRQQP